MLPKTRPTELETLAGAAEEPTASRAGKVISEPEPTIALTPPAAKPAASTARISSALTRSCRRAGRPGPMLHRGDQLVGRGEGVALQVLDRLERRVVGALRGAA